MAKDKGGPVVEVDPIEDARSTRSDSSADSGPRPLLKKESVQFTRVRKSSARRRNRKTLILEIPEALIEIPESPDTDGESSVWSSSGSEPSSPVHVIPNKGRKEKAVPKVVHKVEYRHVTTNAVIFEEESDRFAPTKPPPEEPVLEVITIAFTAQDRSPYSFRHDIVKPPPIHSMGHTYIQINSAAVINALRAVVEYYPGQNLIGDSISISEPYTILVHHEKEIAQFREDFAPDSRKEFDEPCEVAKDTYDHLGIVLDFLSKTTKDSMEKERERHQRAKPVVTFEMLWTLFKPGRDVYFDAQSAGIFDSFIVRNVNWEINNGAPVRYNIGLWNLYYDSIHIGPRNYVAVILPFDGEKEIAKLDVFPCEYLRKSIHKETPETMYKRLEERGKMFFRLTSKQCMWYDGLTTTFPRQKFTGTVMVDAESFWASITEKSSSSKSSNTTGPPALISDDVGERTIGGVPLCFCKRCMDLNNRKKKSKFAEYARINPMTQKELTPHQYWLCERSVWGFIMKVRAWHRLDAANFSEPKFDTKLVDDLVLAEDTKALVKSLSKKYAREDVKKENPKKTTKPAKQKNLDKEITKSVHKKQSNSAPDSGAGDPSKILSENRDDRLDETSQEENSGLDKKGAVEPVDLTENMESHAKEGEVNVTEKISPPSSENLERKKPIETGLLVETKSTDGMPGTADSENDKKETLDEVVEEEAKDGSQVESNVESGLNHIADATNASALEQDAKADEPSQEESTKEAKAEAKVEPEKHSEQSNKDEEATDVTDEEDSDAESETSDQWAADFVQGKGEGLIILLHGKPGVGKTYTAECVAEYTRRPLLSLTCTDIGTNPLAIESKLTYWFKLAKHWGTILLIDEADIYMEHRITRDIDRNHLVAGFLRAMEYYQGILFLTTNRIGTFDDAFISRIHVSIHYREFTDIDRKEVWGSFFKKLETDKGDKMVVSDKVRKYVTTGKDMKVVKWNGREIRNAFQTAVALAEVEGEKVSPEDDRVVLKVAHLQSIVRMSSAFKKYLDTLHQGDETKRAAREGLRVDDFDEVLEREGQGFSHYS